MNKEKFLAYFKRRSQSKDCIQVTNVLTSVSLLTLKGRCKRYTSARKNIKLKFLQRLRKKLACMQEILVLLQQLKSSLLNIQNILLSEPHLAPGRRSAMMVTGTVIKRIGRPNLLDSGMLKRVKNIALGTRMAGGVINRRQLISIATGVVRANNPKLLKEYGGDLVLTDKWARGVLEKLTWSKRKGTTRK